MTRQQPISRREENEISSPRTSSSSAEVRCCRKPTSSPPESALRLTHTFQHQKVFGSDPASNPGLAAAILAAKKASLPKDKIEGALARGQGKSSSGEALESFIFEAVVPPSIALIVDCETESKLRLMQDLHKIVKTADGSASSTKFFFTRVGRVIFTKPEDPKIDVDYIMDDAIEAGAEDLETNEDGNIVAWTQPNGTSQIVQTVGPKFGLKAQSADIFWTPNEETKSKLDQSEESIKFITMLETLSNYPDVQAVYCNVDRGSGLSDEDWEKIAESINQT